MVAPPGSGKTTVVPLRLLQAVEGKIVVLEPRRLATRAAARRMAWLSGDEVGQTVGYSTRHEREVGPRTRIEVVTEGILTRRIQADPTLAGTSLVVFDEVHERNLQTDLALALALDIRRGLRSDLMLLAMSATIDAEPLARLLDAAPVIEVDAGHHPVDLRWRPAPPRSKRLEDQVAKVVREALEETSGDILVFLPGMAEIRRVEERLTGLLADVLILHGALPPEEQDRALAPSSPPFRKIVLSTDIAESSLTVEGVTTVVDSGLARAPRFDPRTGMTRLRTVSISRDSADQRAGRAGRLGPGVAYRLWSKMEQAARRPHAEPEITQVDLAGLALELAAWGVSEPERMSWLDPPPAASWAEAIDLLVSLGAVDGGRITDAGRAMARLPLHPRLARMIVDAGDDAGLAVWLATLVDERDPMAGPPETVPVDVATRVRLLVDRGFHHPAARGSSLHRLRQIALDLAERAGVENLDRVDPERSGPVLALAFPDRLAVRRGGPGMFQLRTGTTARIPPGDSLATEEFLVAADVDGRRRDTRIRLAAAMDRDQVLARFAHALDDTRRLIWDDGRLVERHERRLGGVALEVRDRRPDPSPDTTAALIKRVTDLGLEVLGWNARASSLRARVDHLHRTLGEPWPDWSESALRARVSDWLGPHLVAATGWDDVERIDLAAVLMSELGHRLVSRLNDLAPTHFVTPTGRRVEIDYTRAGPTISVRVQDMFGVRQTPVVGGKPMVVELLSPAGRPIQITSDLAGFWKGSWHEVRKEMAGRYPKHAWPEDPEKP